MASGQNRPRRRYSDEERANAVAAVHANGGKVHATAKQIGVPPKTLEHWVKGEAHPAAAILGEEKKEPLADRFEALAHKLVGIADKKAHDLSAKDAVIAAGVAVDKMRMLRGEGMPASVTADMMSALGQAIAKHRSRKPAAGRDGGASQPVPPVASESGSTV